MNDAAADGEFDPYLPFFDLSPAAFPWTPAKVAAVADARSLTGTLFFDELLGMAAVDASLYPPKDTLTLRHLLNSTLASEFDRLKKDCLVYYLLLDSAAARPAEIFRSERGIPPRFARLTEGYWFLDNKQFENAVRCLTLPSLTPDFVSKILRTLSLHPTPATAAQLVLKFVRFATPDLTTDAEVDIKVDALARVNFREAWEFVESLNEGERKQDLVKRVIVATLSPKPVPAHLQLLLAFPFSSGSEQTLHALCLHPPSALSQASTKVLHDLAHTRLIAQGRLLDAIRLDRSIGSGREGEKRRETIERLVRIVPEVQRRILEVEMGGGEKEQRAAKPNGAALPPAFPPAPTTSATLVAPTPIPAAFLHQQNLPLSASQVLRTSSPQLSVHRAILSPAAAPPPSPARDPAAPPRRPFSFPAPPPPSSPARSAFASAEAAGSPFDNRIGQSPFASSSTAGLPSHYQPQHQPQQPVAHASPARTQPASAAAASPFAQAAKQASQAAYRSGLMGRDQRARQESPRFQPTYSRSNSHADEAREEDDDQMLVVESPPPAAAKKRSAGRRTTEKQPTKPQSSKSTRSSRRQVEEPEAERDEDVQLEEDEEDDMLPGAFPGAAESTSRTPTARRKAAPRAAAASKPAAATTTARGRRAPSVPGSFTTGATSDESDGDELTLADLNQPSAPATRRKTRAAPPPASSSGYGLRKGHVRTRSMSVASDSGEDDELESQGKTPPPSMRKRTLRSSVTVSPEAVRRAGTIPSGKPPSTRTRAAGGSRLKEATSAAPTRRSTRHGAAAGDDQ